MAPAQLAVGDDREASLLLLEDRQTYGVVLRFLQFGSHKPPRCFQHVRRREPRRLRQTSDDGRIEHESFP